MRAQRYRTIFSELLNFSAGRTSGQLSLIVDAFRYKV
jgi:hypothetical protein